MINSVYYSSIQENSNTLTVPINQISLQTSTNVLLMMTTTAMKMQIAQTLMARSHVLANLDTLETGNRVQVNRFYHV